MPDAQSPPVRKPPGRPKIAGGVESYSVMLPPWLHDWAMNQPEGFSALVRHLLETERFYREGLRRIAEEEHLGCRISHELREETIAALREAREKLEQVAEKFYCSACESPDAS